MRVVVGEKLGMKGVGGIVGGMTRGIQQDMLTSAPRVVPTSPHHLPSPESVLSPLLW